MHIFMSANFGNNWPDLPNLAKFCNIGELLGHLPLIQPGSARDLDDFPEVAEVGFHRSDLSRLEIWASEVEVMNNSLATFYLEVIVTSREPYFLEGMQTPFFE